MELWSASTANAVPSDPAELATLETISMKDGFKEAPPTKNPSMLGFVISSWPAENPAGILSLTQHRRERLKQHEPLVANMRRNTVKLQG